MRKKNYIIMGILVVIFSVVWLIVINLLAYYNIKWVSDFTSILLLAVVAVIITILTSLRYLKQKEITASKKIIRTGLTSIVMIAFTITMFYVDIFIALSLIGH